MEMCSTSCVEEMMVMKHNGGYGRLLYRGERVSGSRSRVSR